MTQKFNQSLKETGEQSQVIEELSRQLEAANNAAHQAAAEAENAQRQVAAWSMEHSTNSEQSQRDRETIAALKASLQDARNANEAAEQRIQKLEKDLQNQINALDVAVDRAHTAAEVCVS